MTYTIVENIYMNTLQKALAVRGLTVNQASKMSGLRYDTLWKHVEGMRSISPEMALRYEKSLGIPRSELRPDLWPSSQPTDTSHVSEA